MRSKTQVAVSFENDCVRVVEAVSRDGRLALKVARTFTNDEFRHYLKETKTDQFLVACDFPDLIHEIVVIPPAKEKYMQALVEREVRKSFPEAKDHSFTFHPLREQVRDGKKALELVVYAVENTRVRDIVGIFEASQKRISFLSPHILPIAHLVGNSLETKDEVILTVIDGGATKTLLVSQNGHILFMRVIQSRGFGIDDIDSDNVNMTVTYARQTLRAEPAKVVILSPGEISETEEYRKKLMLPVLDVDLTSVVLWDAQVDREGLFPALGLLLSAANLQWGNLVPKDHTAFFRKKRILKYGAAFFFCSSVVLSGFTLKTLAEVPELKTQIGDIRADMARRQSLWSQWATARDNLNPFLPLISFSNTVEASPDVVSALCALSFLPMKDIKIRTLHLTATPEGIKIEIKGELTAERYGDMSTVYQNLVQTLKQTSGIEVQAHSIEVKTRSFTIDGLIRQGEASSDG